MQLNGHHLPDNLSCNKACDFDWNSAIHKMTQQRNNKKIFIPYESILSWINYPWSHERLPPCLRDYVVVPNVDEQGWPAVGVLVAPCDGCAVRSLQRIYRVCVQRHQACTTGMNKLTQNHK